MNNYNDYDGKKVDDAPDSVKSGDLRADLVKDDHTGMKDDHTGMKDDHTGMKDDHRGMKDDHTGMKDDHTGMKDDHADKGGDHIPPPVTDVPEVADIVLAQDLSGSFSDDLPNLQTPFLSGLATNLTAAGATDVEYGITSFIDYPVDGFGAAGDFIYNTNQAVTADVAVAQTALDGLVIGSGIDPQEAQLVALQQVALRADGEIGYRPDAEPAERFVVLSTDAPFHQAGDFLAGGANNNNTNLADGTGPGGVEDYPSIAQVATDLAAANVTPIFAVTNDQLGTYQALLGQLNAQEPSIGGSVVELSADSSNLSAAIIAGLEAASATADMMIA